MQTAGGCNMINKIRQSLRKINDSYEFKPLLSEIEESPVSPLGRFTFWTVVSLMKQEWLKKF